MGMTNKNGKRDQEVIGNAMLKADDHESHHRKPDSKNFT
jgi:hypothetical protein